MADKRIDLVFDAKVEIGEIRNAIKSLTGALGNLSIPKNVTDDFSKEIGKLNKQLLDFEAQAAKGVHSLSDTKKLDTAWSKVVTSLSKIGLQIDDLSNIQDAIFPKTVIDNIEKANKAIGVYQKKLDDVRKSPVFTQKKADRDAAFTKQTQAFNDLTDSQKKEANARKSFQEAQRKWDNQKEASYQANKAQIASITAQIANQEKVISSLESKRRSYQTSKVITSKGELQTSFVDKQAKAEEKKLAAEAKLVEAQQKVNDAKNKASAAKGKVTKYENKNKGIDLSKDKEYLKLIKEKEAAVKSFADAQKQLEQVEIAARSARDEHEKLSKQGNDALQVVADLEAAKEQKDTLETQKQAYENTNKANEKYRQNLSKTTQDLQDATSVVAANTAAHNQATQAVNTLDAELSQIELSGTTNEWEALRQEILKFSNIDINNFAGDLDKVQQALDDYKIGEIKDIPTLIQKIRDAAQSADKPVRDVGDGIGDMADEVKELTRAQQEVEHLKNQILDFFSITSTIQIFKNALRDAYETVKELDAAMTETAVVTDFTVGDMWDQLPKYTEAANKLGTTTLGAYETMTLFYQQGLNTNETFEIGTETMKMARIAGLDYADATDKMTAALRGFNMELNAASAQRVNDVYSELAAITAADTEEIANAMTKTASIADNANMEFETTAAFLSQIIETTRESAETAGTAMKTVIARFQELKKDPSLIGEVDGEMVDANKIEGALRTIGVALRDTSGQFRDLDDVFLDIAKKWDSLDINTQRYIATIAAGSRQQSRFIAMMSNYDRTLELVNAANNSAGASQRQFEKTTESLESKLNKLKNAWDRFTMGLANNELIKLGVDLLTNLLNTINDITEVLPGITSSFAKLAIVIGGLKAGSSIFNTFFANLGIGTAVQNVINTDQIVSPWKALTKTFGDLFEKVKTGGGNFKTFLETTKTYMTNAGGAVAGLKTALGSFGTKLIGLATGPIGITVISIAALIAIFYALEKAIKTPEEELEEATKAADEAAEAANHAAEAFDNLQNSLDAIDNRSNEIEELARGTTAWKNAVHELNNEVLDLLEKYPELSTFVKNEGGVLTIDYEKENAMGDTVEDILKTYEMDSIRAQSAASAAKIAEVRAQEEFDYSETAIAKEIEKLRTGSSTSTKLSEQSVKELALAFAKGEIGNGEGQQSLDNFLRTAGIAEDDINRFATTLSDSADELREFGNKLISGQEQVNTYIDSIASNAISMMNKDDYTDAETSRMANFMTADIMSTLVEQAEKEIGSVTDQNRESLLEEYADIMNLQEASISGNTITYKDGDEEKTKTLTDEQLKSQLAHAKATDKAKEAMERFTKSLPIIKKELGKDLGPIVQKIYDSPEGGALTKGDLSQIGVDLENYTVEGLTAGLNDQAKQLWDNSEALKSVYGNFEDFQKAYVDSIIFAAESYRVAEKDLNEVGMKFDSKNLSSGAVSGIVDNLMDVIANSGVEKAKHISNLISNVIETLDEDKAEKFAMALNSMDWNSIKSVGAFSEDLKELGISFSDLGPQIQSLMNILFGYAKETYAPTIEELTNEINTLAGIREELKGREDTERTLEEDDYKALIGAFPELKDSFFGTTYTGDSLDELIKTLNERIDYLIGKSDNAPQFSDIKYSASSSGQDILNISPKNEQDIISQKNALKTLIVEEEKLAVMYERLQSETSAWSKDLKDSDKYLMAQAIDMLKSQKNLDALNSSLDDNVEALKNSEKDSAAYTTALDNITVAAKKVFGDNVNSEFVEENLQNFLKMAKGGVEAQNAYETLAKKSTAAFLKMEEDSQEFETILSTIKDNISGDIDIGATFDPTNAINGLIALGYAAEDAVAIMEGLGYEVTYTTKTMYKDWSIGGQLVENRPSNGAYEVVEVIESIATKKGASGTGFTPSGKGGGNSKDNKWENPYDKLYNLTEDINEALREREQIEKRYDILLARRQSNSKLDLENHESILANLNKQASLQKEMAESREEQLKTFLNENSSMAKYGTYNFEDQTLEIDWAKINKVTNPEEGQKIEDYIGKLEEMSEGLETANDELLEIESTILEVNQELVDSYLEYEDRVASALENIAQKEIDELQATHDAITKADEDLVDAINTNLTQIRQDRENKETEEEIGKMERRLAYLRQDTTGAHQLEIKELEEELAQAKQDYGDSLIDQSLEQLQIQNDEAAEQRERQIEIMQSQLNWNKENGVYVKQAEQLLRAAFEDDNFLTSDDELYSILYNGEGWGSFSYAKLDEILKEMSTLSYNANTALQSGAANSENTNFTELMQEELVKSGGVFTQKFFDLNAQLNKKLLENPDIAEKWGVPIRSDEEAKEYFGNWYEENYGTPNNSGGSGASGGNNDDTSEQDTIYSVVSGDTLSGIAARQYGDWRLYDELADYNNIADPNVIRVGQQIKLPPKHKLTQFATGGLADFTGPAWLDGTKAKPELVLNAADTENFIQLRDILRESGVDKTTSQNNGEMYIDIDINVDEISNDYDVEQLVDKIKREIVQDAQYRNVNAVKFLR